jgi:hypothetical protein
MTASSRNTFILQHSEQKPTLQQLETHANRRNTAMTASSGKTKNKGKKHTAATAEYYLTYTFILHTLNIDIINLSILAHTSRHPNISTGYDLFSRFFYLCTI